MYEAVEGKRGAATFPMATITDKVENALNECRMLVLGLQIFIGFHFPSVLESAFQRIPFYAKEARLATLAAELGALALLLWPTARHRLIERGRDTEHFHAFITSVVKFAIALFA